MDNSSRFEMYKDAIIEFSKREGHCFVPAVHVEVINGKEIFLGAWVGYARQRKKKNQISKARALELESIPGWAHNIKNIGNDEMVVMLWANENFDHSNPDTFSYQI